MTLPFHYNIHFFAEKTVKTVTSGRMRFLLSQLSGEVRVEGIFDKVGHLQVGRRPPYVVLPEKNDPFMYIGAHSRETLFSWRTLCLSPS
jgi:hypothetical protein